MNAKPSNPFALSEARPSTRPFGAAQDEREEGLLGSVRPERSAKRGVEGRGGSGRTDLEDDRLVAARSRGDRRVTGLVLTPQWLIDAVLAEALAPRLARAEWRNGVPSLRILDPAAGSGRFLVACADHIAQAGVARGFDYATTRKRAVANCLVGIERDPALADMARDVLGAGADIRVGEALLGGVVNDRAWDLVVGNPPYVRSVTLKRGDPPLWAAIKGRFAATSRGEWDLYGAFIERTLDWLAADGEAGLVVPSRWLTGGFAAPLRQLLAERRALRLLVDFGTRQCFEGATTYSSLVFLSARPKTSVAIRRETEPGRWQSGRLSTQSLGSAPWQLPVGSTRTLLDGLAAAGPKLSDVARVVKGAGTNADSIFLLTRERAQQLGIESSLLVPCVRGRDVRRFRLESPRVALLPYSACGELVAWKTVGREAPRAARYLTSVREALERRERGRFTGDRFHAWGRPQNLVFHRDASAKIVVPDAAFDGRAALDTNGRMVIDTAYAIRALGDYPLGLLLAVFNSPMVRLWLSATGIMLRGGYVRMKTAYLAGLPLPNPDSRGARKVAALALDATEDSVALEDAVAELYGLKSWPEVNAR